jgi:hypothetical protein
VGNTPDASDPGAGSTSHAHLFDAVGHSGTTTATTRKSAGTSKGLSSQACDLSSRHSQNKQKGEKAQNGLLDLSFAGLCFASHSSFFALSH